MVLSKRSFKKLKAELKGYQEGKKDFIEMIDKMPNKLRKILEDPELLETAGIEIRKLIDAEEIKSSIIGSEEIKCV